MVHSPLISELSRRERQIMDIVYRLGAATAAEVAAQLPDSPGNSTVRKLMAILEEKGLLGHRPGDNNRFLYSPTIPADEASRTMLDHLLETFFKGSAPRAAIALLKRSEAELSDDDRDALQQLIDASRCTGR